MSFSDLNLLWLAFFVFYPTLKYKLLIPTLFGVCVFSLLNSCAPEQIARAEDAKEAAFVFQLTLIPK